MPRKRTKDRYFTKKEKEEIRRTHRLNGNFTRTMKLHDIIHRETLYTILGIRDLSPRYKKGDWYETDGIYFDRDDKKITGIIEDANEFKVVHGKRIR